MTSIAVRVPASSANLGPGFDVLGMALDLPADVGTGDPPPGARTADEHHPATIAFRELGGPGALWLRTSIPMSRGLGYSGAVRVAGAAVAAIQRAADREDASRLADGLPTGGQVRTMAIDKSGVRPIDSSGTA